MTITTRLTKLLGIELPIVQAGMSWASSSAALPLAVSRAGGLGVIAAGPMRIDDLSAAMADVRAGTDRPFAVNLPLYRKGSEEIIEHLLAAPVPVLIASQGGTQKYLDRFKAVGTLCIHVVSSEYHARRAADAGVDALIVVGGEAGGHPPPDLVSTLVLVRAIARAVPDIPLIASGGIADGCGIAAVLALGADGAQLGTRFLMSDEATVHADYKRVVGEAGIADTLVVGRDIGPIRLIGNDFSSAMREAEGNGTSLDERKAIFAASTLKHAALDGEVAHGKIEAGQSAGLVDAVLPAAAIVQQLADELFVALQRVGGLIGDRRATGPTRGAAA